MSQLLINDYLKQLDVIKRASGSHRQTNVREAFKDPLKSWGRQHNLVFLAEYPLKTATKIQGEGRRPDRSRDDGQRGDGSDRVGNVSSRRRPYSLPSKAHRSVHGKAHSRVCPYGETCQT